jgi:CelD/BcsL family acetyltransferase involved in cellulose biosynthesis
MLGVGNRLEPLAASGAEERTARAIAAALAEAEPRPARISFLGAPTGSVWARAIAASWPAPRRADVAVDRVDVAPALELEGSFDGWFAGRSSNFRSQMRRAQRQLAELGGVLRQAEPEELDDALTAFARLHHARWEDRGGSGSLNSGIEQMLREAAAQLPGDRFRLWLIELDGEIVNAHLFVAAGGVVSYWLGGFDERIAALRPALITILAAIEQAFASGDRRVDLGAGGQDYKYRFADGDDQIEWLSVVPPGRGSLRVRRQIAAARLRRGLADRLPEHHRARVKGMLGKVRHS